MICRKIQDYHTNLISLAVGKKRKYNDLLQISKEDWNKETKKNNLPKEFKDPKENKFLHKKTIF